MKTILTTIAATLVVSLAAFGIPFEGTFVQTVTFTDDPLVSVGETFTGTYRYDSPVIDGVYYARSPGPLDTSPLVRGSYYIPGLGVVDFGTTFPFDPVLTVSGGVVTDFRQAGQIGGRDFSVRLTGFGVVRPSVQLYSTNGTVSFTNPTANVPDNAIDTAWLLAIGLFGLALVRPLLGGSAR